MLIILPLLVFLLVFLDLLALQSRREPSTSLRAVFLETTAFTGGYLMIFSEGLSLFKQLGQGGVAVCWGLAILIAGGIGLQQGLLVKAWQILRAKRQKLEKSDIFFGAALGLILGLLLVIALLSPPNNNDSLRYHMSRVMHWAQNHSFSFYATAYIPQLVNSIWSEAVILNARLLWGDDQLANLVSWGSLLGSLVGVSAVAKLLGASRKGQWVAIAFAASLPMAILEGTNPQNNLITAFWLVGLFYFVILSAQRDLFIEEILGLAFTFGLGLATKATFYPYCVPPMLYFIVHQFVRNKPYRGIGRGLLIAGIALALNLGFWGRNLIAFGGPMGPAGFVETSTFSSLTPGGIAGKLVGNIFLNLDTPKDSLNAQIVSWLQTVFRTIDPQIMNYRLVAGWNYEDLAGNPLHLFLIPISCLLLITNRKRIPSPWITAYCLITISLYLMLAIVVNSGYTDGRYQLPFFIAWAPVFGVAIEALQKKPLFVTVVALLLIAALPWVLFNRTRPLIAMRPSTDPFTIPCLAGCTAGSILNEPPVRILFAGGIELQGPYTLATGVIRKSACRSVGLQIDSHDLEYPFWWLLDAPQSGIRLETIYPAQGLARFIDPNFKPCAILCTICRGKNRLHGLDLMTDYSGRVQLYMGSSYTPDPNP